MNLGKKLRVLTIEPLREPVKEVSPFRVIPAPSLAREQRAAAGEKGTGPDRRA